MAKDVAIISTYDKTGLASFCKVISSHYEFLCTGGTHAYLKKHGIESIKIESVTEFPELLNGRVKTLHPKVFASVLARESEEDRRELEQYKIPNTTLVVCNFYPFKKTKDFKMQYTEKLEYIDIGGPALVRAAIKNYQKVVILTDPNDYPWVAEKIVNQSLTLEDRLKLMEKALNHVIEYNVAIKQFFEQITAQKYPTYFTITGFKQLELRYGENPHQYGYLYTRENKKPFFIQLSGKKVSYNNILDCMTALQILNEFNRPTAAIIKHTSPCGVACADTLEDAFLKAFETDKISAYGSFMGFNRKIDLKTAEHLHNMFVDGIIAPDYDEDSFKLLTKKKKLMLLKMTETTFNFPNYEVTMIPNGFIVQDFDRLTLTEKDFVVVSNKKPTAKDVAELLFAWKIVKQTKSNAAVVAKETFTLGCAAGKSSRIDAVRYAIGKAGERAENAVLASDAFFPFRDSIDFAAENGIRAVIAPGGSIRDPESVAAAKEHNIVFVFARYRAFRH